MSDAVFRAICRSFGADLCVTEFVNSDSLLRNCRNAQRKLSLGAGDTPTAIQIYGANPETLVEAARIAESADPIAIDLNCGCWVPKVAGRGAGAGWLREPDAMVAMAKRVVDAVALPVTVKTRIGWGPESHMPIVDLARRLEDAGVRALTIHCRTAQMGHRGDADWAWARRAREAVRIPVIVNGDVRSADDCKRALDETGCAGVMIGRRAMAHPWIFREARAWLDRGERLAPPSRAERLGLALLHLRKNVQARGERGGVLVTRRHYAGYLATLPDMHTLRAALNACDSFWGTEELLLLSVHGESPRLGGDRLPNVMRPEFDGLAK